MANHSTFSLATVAALSCLAVMVVPVEAADDNPFPGLVGAWSGSGEARLEGGKTEKMQCRGYYRGESSAVLGIAIRCANPSAKIDLRATLSNQNGTVSGNWEERTYNAGGQVTGKASASKVNLAISGGGLTATMAVSVNGPSHSVNISTQGIPLKGVSISLARSGG
jgi:hypothetical protein